MSHRRQTLIYLNDTELQQTIHLLRQLPRKGRSLKEIVAYLQEEIQQVRVKGYSYQEVADLLKQQGITISAHTLRQYLAEANKSNQVNKLSGKKSTKQKTTEHPLADTQGRHTIGHFVEMPDEL